MATHAVFTIVADVQPGAEPALEADLQGFDAATRFVGLPRLHFASFVVFDAKCLERPLSKLVLECAIDGPIGPILRDLDRHCDLSRVFRHCQEYARAENTLQYLRAHVQKPHLYHVGTPYQSAASILSDIRQRDDFDQRLRKAGVLSLDALLRNVPAGMREYWRLEILEPWLALPIAVAGPWVAWLIWSHMNWHEWRQIIASLLNVVAAGGVVFLALLYAFVSWQSALPQIRRRVISWMGWLANGSPGSSLPWSWMRSASVLWNASQEIQRRWLLSIFDAGRLKGAYWGIGSSVAPIRTSYDRFSLAEAAVLENHGYLLADAAIQTHFSGWPIQPAPLRIPNPGWMREDLIRQALIDSATKLSA